MELLIKDDFYKLWKKQFAEGFIISMNETINEFCHGEMTKQEKVMFYIQMTELDFIETYLIYKYGRSFISHLSTYVKNEK